MQYKINGFSYNDSNGIVNKGQQRFQLTKIQKKLFNYFIQNPKITISKQKIMDEVWGRTVTENSIEKTLSKLRNVIEDNPLNPKILITHHGHGISFEGNIEAGNTSQKVDTSTLTSKKSKFIALFFIPSVLFLLWWIIYAKPPLPLTQDLDTINDRHIMVLPTVFDESIKSEDSIGINELLKSTFNNLDSKGKIHFNESESPPKEVMQRHWRINKDLVMMQTRVKKNGEIYDAVVEITSGLKTLKQVNLRAQSLSELANKQIELLANYTRSDDTQYNTHSINYQVKPIHLQTLTLMKNKNFKEAQQLLKQYLKTNDSDFYARYLMGYVLLETGEYKKSLVQLDVVKQSPFYQNNSAVVEILIADNHRMLGENTRIIDDLSTYLSTHLEISPLSQSKIKIHLADAYVNVGNTKEALKFFKQAISNLDERYHPQIYALSYFGQARVENSTSNSQHVYHLFEKSLHYAKLDKNIEYQATILDAMSGIMFFNNQWEEGLQLKRESLALMEIVDDKSSGYATGLGVLASYLIERGLFTEAREVVDRIDVIAKALKSDHLSLIKSHYDVSIELLLFHFDYCQSELDKSLSLAKKTNNHAMYLNAIFLQMELLLAKNDTLGFKAKYDKYSPLFNQTGLDRYKIFMDLYLARYYKEVGEKTKAIDLLGKVSELAKQSGDLKFLTDAQNVLSQIYLPVDPNKALEVLNAIEQYHPNPNPYLENKAKVLHALNRDAEALALILEAKVAYNEAWSAENQALLEQLQEKIKQ